MALKSKSKFVLEKKLGEIAKTIGETVVFHVGFKKSGEVDILGVDVLPSKKQQEIAVNEPVDDLRDYIG